MDAKRKAVAITSLCRELLFKRKKQRSEWIKERFTNRNIYSDVNLVNELKADDPKDRKLF